MKEPNSEQKLFTGEHDTKEKTLSLDSLTIFTPNAEHRATFAKLITAEDGDIIESGQTVTFAKGWPKLRLPKLRKRGNGPEGAGSGGRRMSKADRVNKAMKEKLGYGASGYIPDAVGAAVLGGAAMGAVNLGLFTKAVTDISAVLSFLGAEVTSLALIGGLALIPGMAGAAYWILKKTVKGTIGRFGAWALPRTTKFVDDTVASIWLGMDKAAYQLASMKGPNKFWEIMYSPLALAGYAYMFYRSTNGMVSSALNGDWTKFKHNAKSAALIVGRSPERSYRDLIEEEEKEINNTNPMLQLVNFLTNLPPENPVPSSTEQALAEAGA